MNSAHHFCVWSRRLDFSERHRHLKFHHDSSIKSSWLTAFLLISILLLARPVNLYLAKAMFEVFKRLKLIRDRSVNDATRLNLQLPEPKNRLLVQFMEFLQNITLVLLNLLFGTLIDIALAVCLIHLEFHYFN